ncbi:MAG: bifunctional methylenetetrahydrofolate dehydrogenase/methenyltetrahydrofolate cyclohydrolase [Candidatus Bathyarchaeota archaeon]|jgi:methylenetetrahydrofolate dehydrogenase (NADP+)/methenyltetrahydrofolate cyclohydrolase|nr:bifunctional methylenetetrahydrofolate dehydrogenase/methenyltetrahydrofolate cyclohydrolase [Candidatus Bathyarchaeota archaeon]
MVVILDGKETSAKIVEEVRSEVVKLKAKGINPTLALILVGVDPGSTRYVNLKVKRAEEAGITTQFYHLETATTEQAVSLIKKLNADPNVHGVMVQLPAPKEVNEGEIVEAIAPEKDVDGLSPVTFGKIVLGEKSFLPAGVEAIMELLKRYNINPEGKHWVVAGLTSWLGKPMAALLLNKKVEVTAFAAGDLRLPEFVKQADVLCIEVYKKGAVTADMVKKGVVIIDNGNNYEGKKVFGDVEFEGVSPLASAITPVPGGVGPLLITMLLRNTVKAALTS